MKLTKKDIEEVIAQYREAIRQTKQNEADINSFIESVSKTLFDYCAQFPEGTEFQYNIRRLFGRMQLKILIPGERKSLYESGENSQERELLRQVHSMRTAISMNTQYAYINEANVLSFLMPPARGHSGLRSPMIIAALIGLILGFLSSYFPSNITVFLINDLASPVLNIVIKLMTGIMGPIIFLSIVTAVSTADSISEVNILGVKLLKRFLTIAIFITLTVMLVAFFVFSFRRGKTNLDFSPQILIGMILSVIPTNLLTPFTENNFPQLLVLGLVMGIALLLLNKRKSVLGSVLMDLHDWLNELLRLVLKLTPIIPGLTLFKIFAEKDYQNFIRGWKFIAAAYACMAIILLLKLIKVKLCCRQLDLLWLLRAIGPAVSVAFFSGSEIAAIKKCEEIVGGPLAVPDRFSSLWIPLNQAMLAPVGPVYYVLAPFFVAELTGTPVSLQFLFILMILSVQLSLAYPGITAGITIIFNALDLSADYIGIFSAYSVFIRNASSAYGVAYRLLEVTEAVRRTGNI